MYTLAARRAKYQTSQQQQKSSSSSGAAAGGARWSTADDRALEEAVIWARMELLFVGVKMMILESFTNSGLHSVTGLQS